MTLNSALKKQVRDRMAATGENYTTALRSLTSVVESPLEASLRPGTVTLAINGGGQLNAALFLPELARLARAGHELILAPLSREKEVTELPSYVDLMVVAGGVEPGAAADLAEDPDGLIAAMARTFPRGFKYVDGQMPASSLIAELRHAQESTGKAPVVYVQDIQEGGAVLVSPYDDEVAQAARLREIAEQTGAIVAAGHCMPAHMEASWMPAAAAAGQAFAIEETGREGDERLSSLRHIVEGRQVATIDWTLDLGPFSGRTELFNRHLSATR